MSDNGPAELELGAGCLSATVTASVPSVAEVTAVPPPSAIGDVVAGVTAVVPFIAEVEVGCVPGPPGPEGPEGPAGPAGPAGPGVPTGGTTGQVLSKVSNTSYDTTWTAPGGDVSDVVWVGPSAPTDPDTELWWDTDDPGTMFTGSVIALTQAEYDALDPPDPETLYVITDSTALISDSMHLTGDLEVDGALNHDGSTAGFYGTLPVAKPSTVGPLAALEALGLGTSLILDTALATNSGTIEGTSTDTAVTPAGLDYYRRLRGRDINTRTSDYTFLLADAEKIITMNASTPLTLTIPTEAELLPVGAHVDIVRLGTGTVTVAASGGVTVNGTPGLKLRAQYSKAQLIKLAANNWLLTGDISA